MQVAFLGSAESWYYSDLLRAAKVGEELVAISYRELMSRCGTWPAVQAADEDLAARFSDGVQNLASCDAVLMRTMPPGSLEQVIFRMDVLGCYEQQGGIVLNPPRAVEAAVDKYLATCRLDLAGIPVPRTVVCQNVGEALQAFEQLGGDVAIDPDSPLFNVAKKGERDSIIKKWWFWTIIGTVVVGGAVTVVLLTLDEDDASPGAVGNLDLTLEQF